MAQNFVACGEVVEYVNNTGSAIISESPVIMGATVGVALVDIADGDSGNVMLEGVFELAKTTPLVITQGDEVFWNTTTKRITKTATDKPFGVAYESAASSATVVHVLLHGSISATPQAALVAAITTANGSDAGTTQALANATKTTVNAIITALQNAGIMVAS
jgi:predicted RecA/RadA family phage recombinase